MSNSIKTLLFVLLFPFITTVYCRIMFAFVYFVFHDFSSELGDALIFILSIVTMFLLGSWIVAYYSNKEHESEEEESYE